MTFMEMRLLALLIRKARDETTRIGNRKLQRRRSRTLVVASRIIAVPRKNTRDGGKHACSHKKRHSVLYFRVRRLADDSVADDCNGEGTQHDWAAESEAVGENGDDDGEDGSDGVRNDGPELGFVRVLSEAVVDDCGEEEAERVEA